MKLVSSLCSVLFAIAYSGTLSAADLITHAYNVRGVKIDYSPSAQPLQSSLNDTTRARVVEQALGLAGTHYQYGGSKPETGFDCSGFVQYVYQQAANISLPRTAAAIHNAGTAINQSDLQNGDLVFFNIDRKSNAHLGIYIGHNRMIHAPSTGKSVSISKLDNRYWKSRLSDAIRITKP